MEWLYGCEIGGSGGGGGGGGGGAVVGAGDAAAGMSVRRDGGGRDGIGEAGTGDSRFRDEDFEVLKAVYGEMGPEFWDMVAREVSVRIGEEFSAQECEVRLRQS